MADLMNYLNTKILGSEVWKIAVFTAYSAGFLFYCYYCKKHPDVFDKLNKKLGLEKKIDSEVK